MSPGRGGRDGSGGRDGRGGRGGPGGRDGSPLLAVDVGGTNMRCAVVDSSGAVIEAARVATPHGDAGPGALVDLVASVLGLPAAAGVRAAVVGLPGQVNYACGTLEWAPHLPPSWLPELSASKLSAAVGVEVALANDADLAAVGEACFGAGRGYADMAYVTISTGVGAGVVLGGRLVHGQRSLAELGHTVIDRSALAAGLPASMEDQASGTALARMATEAGLQGGGSQVQRLAEAGDGRACEVWGRMIEAVGIGLANLAEVFCPEVIVVGGGVGLAEGFLGPVRARFAERRPEKIRGPVLVVRAELGDDAGLRGAAAWASAFSPPSAAAGRDF